MSLSSLKNVLIDSFEFTKEETTYISDKFNKSPSKPTLESLKSYFGYLIKLILLGRKANIDLLKHYDGYLKIGNSVQKGIFKLSSILLKAKKLEIDEDVMDSNFIVSDNLILYFIKENNITISAKVQSYLQSIEKTATTRYTSTTTTTTTTTTSSTTSLTNNNQKDDLKAKILESLIQNEQLQFIDKDSLKSHLKEDLSSVDVDEIQQIMNFYKNKKFEEVLSNKIFHEDLSDKGVNLDSKENNLVKNSLKFTANNDNATKESNDDEFSSPLNLGAQRKMKKYNKLSNLIETPDDDTFSSERKIYSEKEINTDGIEIIEKKIKQDSNTSEIDLSNTINQIIFRGNCNAILQSNLNQMFISRIVKLETQLEEQSAWIKKTQDYLFNINRNNMTGN